MGWRKYFKKQVANNLGQMKGKISLSLWEAREHTSEVGVQVKV